MNLADYLEQHAEIVPYQQTRFLLKVAADELRRNHEGKNNTNFYIKQLPNGDFSVVYE